MILILVGHGVRTRNRHRKGQGDLAAAAVCGGPDAAELSTVPSRYFNVTEVRSQERPLSCRVHVKNRTPLTLTNALNVAHASSLRRKQYEDAIDVMTDVGENFRVTETGRMTIELLRPEEPLSISSPRKVSVMPF